MIEISIFDIVYRVALNVASNPTLPCYGSFGEMSDFVCMLMHFWPSPSKWPKYSIWCIFNSFLALLGLVSEINSFLECLQVRVKCLFKPTSWRPCWHFWGRSPKWSTWIIWVPFGVISSFPPPPRPLRDAYVDAFWGPFDMRNRVRGKDLVWSDLVWSGVLNFAKFCLEKKTEIKIIWRTCTGTKSNSNLFLGQAAQMVKWMRVFTNGLQLRMTSTNPGNLGGGHYELAVH